MKKYQMIAIDMDGTLLTNAKNILKETKEDILTAHNSNKIVCISTGRGFPAIKRYIDELDINIPLILYNGSRVRMSKDSTLIFNQVIDSKVAKKVFENINKNNGTCCFWREDVCYCNKKDGFIEYYEKLTTISLIEIANPTDELFQNINKFIWFGTIEFLEIVQKELLVGIEGIDYFKSNSNLLEIVPTGVSKGNSLKQLIQKLGIAQEDIIAIGDDENDISMIKFAGLGVAMENAKEIVKKVADYITVTNEENGVGKIINDFLI